MDFEKQEKERYHPEHHEIYYTQQTSFVDEAYKNQGSSDLINNFASPSQDQTFALDRTFKS